CEIDFRPCGAHIGTTLHMKRCRMMTAATEVARTTRINANRSAFENVMTALDQPARELPRLKRAAQHYKDVVHDSGPKAAT
ncbi:MAG: DUF1778 domain-containing protein, partial [Alloalcanivorax venustensis]|uniref:type II toxin -antitoxin system TacA 1-like antitoxin n=2 Tax=Alloalcanivorax venustensis TaxID=172371 RepID=UPI003C35037A